MFIMVRLEEKSTLHVTLFRSTKATSATEPGPLPWKPHPETRHQLPGFFALIILQETIIMLIFSHTHSRSDEQIHLGGLRGRRLRGGRGLRSGLFIVAPGFRGGVPVRARVHRRTACETYKRSSAHRNKCEGARRPGQTERCLLGPDHSSSTRGGLSQGRLLAGSTDTQHRGTQPAVLKGHAGKQRHLGAMARSNHHMPHHRFLLNLPVVPTPSPDKDTGLVVAIPLSITVHDSEAQSRYNDVNAPFTNSFIH